jgi:hypothetical protein
VASAVKALVRDAAASTVSVPPELEPADELLELLDPPQPAAAIATATSAETTRERVIAAPP